MSKYVLRWQKGLLLDERKINYSCGSIENLKKKAELLAKDDKYKTKMFKAFVDSYIAHLYSDMKHGEDVRGMLLYMLREKQKLDINEFADKAIKDDLKDSFKDHAEEKGIESFNIDKKWVEKNLKNRHIKTDTGFEIKGKMDDFEDFMKYGIRHNGNGTIDIVIKNVHFYNEK
ncbi:hypothetical protein C4T45_09710 [Clostridioides difficile]